MNELFHVKPVLNYLWLIYWMTALLIGLIAIGNNIRRLRVNQNKHLWSLFFLLVALEVNLFLNFVAEINWENTMLNDSTRIGAMIISSLLIVCLPAFINSYKITRLHVGLGRFFTIAGFSMALHYVASSVFFFSFRYDGSIRYFGGYRYLPAYTVFIIGGFSVLYALMAVYIARPVTPEDNQRIRILRFMSMGSLFLYPFIFVIDLVRYFFPLLWNPLTEERLFIIPLLYSVINLFSIQYVRQGFHGQETEPDTFNCLSAREAEVAELLCEGCSYKEIAESLFISLSTVQSHVSKIYRKVGINKKESLILIKRK